MPGDGGQLDATPRTAAYCRAARRLRGRWTHRPHRLHLELRNLAERRDAATASTPPCRDIPRGKCEVFATEVLESLDGPVLRHSERRRLFAAARGKGIGRFEANLIIAAVQHERRLAIAEPVTPAAQTPPRRTPVGPIALVVAVEAVIAWGAWLVLCA